MATDNPAPCVHPTPANAAASIQAEMLVRWRLCYLYTDMPAPGPGACQWCGTVSWMREIG
jgi:hypothetical protein